MTKTHPTGIRPVLPVHPGIDTAPEAQRLTAPIALTEFVPGPSDARTPVVRTLETMDEVRALLKDIDAALASGLDASRALRARFGFRRESQLDRFRARLAEFVDDQTKGLAPVWDLTRDSALSQLLGFYSTGNDTPYGGGRTDQGMRLAQGPVNVGPVMVTEATDAVEALGLRGLSADEVRGVSVGGGRQGVEFESAYGVTLDLPPNAPPGLLTQVLLSERAGETHRYRWSLGPYDQAGEDRRGEVFAPTLEAAVDALAQDPKIKALVAGNQIRDVGEAVRTGRLQAVVDTPRGTRRMQTPDAFGAFSLGYVGIDLFREADWSAGAHRVRERSPLALQVEPDELEWDEEDARFRVEANRDFNIDLYIDGESRHSADVLGALHALLRARVRMDTPFEVRRILFQAKFGGEGTPVQVNLGGQPVDIVTKTARKSDARLDQPRAEDVRTMLQGAEDGRSWGGSLAKAPVLMHRRAQHHGLLGTLGGHEDFLAFRAAGYALSNRARTHFNRSVHDDVLRLFQAATQGDPQRIGVDQGLVGDAVRMLLRRRSGDDSSGGQLPAPIATVVAQGRALLADPSEAIVDALRAAGETALADRIGAGPIPDALLPQALRSVRQSREGRARARERYAVGCAFDAVYHAFAEALDALLEDEAIYPRAPRNVREQAETFMAAQRDAHRPLRRVHTTYGTFLRAFEAERTRDAEALATSLSIDPSDVARRDTELDAVQAHLEAEHLEVLHRQIEAAGTAARHAGLNTMERAYVNARVTGNFSIWTADVVHYLSPSAFANLNPDPALPGIFGVLSPAQRGQELPPESHIADSEFVLENQVELSWGAAYLRARKAPVLRLLVHAFAAMLKEEGHADATNADGVAAAFIERAETIPPPPSGASDDWMEAREEKWHALAASLNEVARRMDPPLPESVRFALEDVALLAEDPALLLDDSIANASPEVTNRNRRALIRSTMEAPLDEAVLTDLLDQKSGAEHIFAMVVSALDNLGQSHADRVEDVVGDAVRDNDWGLRRREVGVDFAPRQRAKGEHLRDLGLHNAPAPGSDERASAGG